MHPLLVTGGCGFIGSNYVRYLIETDSEVHVVNIDSLTYAGNLANLADLEKHPRYKFVYGDITDKAAVRKAIGEGVSGIVNFGFGLLALAGLLFLFYSDRATPMLIFIPVIAAVQFVFTLALAVIVSAINVFYRDIGNVMRHALRLWFYLSPGLYSVQQISKMTEGHPTIGTIIGLNPFTVLFESYRGVIYDGTLPSFTSLAALLAFSAGLLLIATLFFKRAEPSFAKVL